MTLRGMWIDPDDDAVVTLDGGSPETASPEAGIITAINDKSDSVNGVVGARIATFLASFDGADAATSFTSEDAEARVATFVANAQLDAAQFKFGATSLLVDGTGDYVSFPDHEDFELGAGDWTMEMWVRFNGDPGTANMGFISKWNESSPLKKSYIWDINNNEMRFIHSVDGVTGVVSYSEAWNPVGSQWYHLAIVRDGTTITGFVDGVALAGDTTVSTDSFSDEAVPLLIGAEDIPGGIGAELNGWIDDVRMVKGTALYHLDFTPPTRAHHAIEGPTATYDASGRRLMNFDELGSLARTPPVASLLASFDGADGDAGSPEYYSEDVNVQLATFVSGAVLDDAQSKFGGTSLLVKGTLDGVTFPDSDVYNFGGGDFTVEMWVRFDASPTANKMFIGQWASGQLSWVWLIVSGLLRFDRSTTGSGQNTMIDDAFVPASGQWYHLAVCRRGTEMEQWVDGVSIGTSSVVSTDVFHDSTAALEIGWYVLGGFGHDGWIEDVRVIKGEAVYPTGNFAPPDRAHSITTLPSMEGPDFTCIAAISDNNRTISDLILDFNAVSPNDAYTSDDYGARVLVFNGTAFIDTSNFRFGDASLYCDGGGDYVDIPSSADLTLGLEDFTIEFWFRSDNIATQQTLYEQRTIAVDDMPLIYLTGSQLLYYVAGSARITSSALSSTTWYHVRVIRKDAVTEMFIDGVSHGTWADTTDYQQERVRLGSNITPGVYFAGFIDAVRVIKGVALEPDAPVFGLTGAASPLDASGWRMNRSSMDALAPSVGDEDTNVATVEAALEGDMIVSMQYDSVAGYLVGHAGGLPGTAVAYNGPLGFEQDFILGDLPGDVLELVYVERNLRTDERQRVEGYLRHKWDMEEHLPTAHPFEAEGPDIVIDSVFIANFSEASGYGGSPEYVAETGQIGSFFDNAEVNSTLSKFNGVSLTLDGTGDYVTFPDSRDYDLDTGDFTIECWAYLNELSRLQTLIAKRNGGSQHGFALFLNASDELEFYAWNPTETVSLLLGTDTLTTGQWYHIAVCRKGNTYTIFLDGQSYDTLSSFINVDSNTSALHIGRDETNTTRDFNGNIDSVRIVQGEALYRHDFTPPLREFKVPVVASLIANFNGPDGIASPPGYVTEDVNAQVPTFTGDAQLDTAQAKFGISSLLVDGTLDAVELPSIADYNFGSGDFTIEMWVRFNVSTGDKTFIAQWDNAGNQKAWYFGVSSNNLAFSRSTSGLDQSTVYSSSWSSRTTGQWYHVAICRRGTEMEAWVDGVSLGKQSTISTDTLHSSTSVVEIGYYVAGAVGHNGWIDGIRVTKGVALYGDAGSPDSDFTVPFDAPGEPII